MLSDVTTSVDRYRIVPPGSCASEAPDSCARRWSAVGGTQLATIFDAQARTEVELSTEQKVHTAVLIDHAIRLNGGDTPDFTKPVADVAADVICRAAVHTLASHQREKRRPHSFRIASQF
ncbi:hypothetical protein [Amycolatopsis sacchari]|uniref:hypothetical protein n=1 Tax=Amycolatopsis sacchari TaxID=115433 RepID=UPI003EB8D6D8